MALASGTRLGVYEILTLIGVGGMGEVYRATDTRLKRDVALKVLPDTFAQDADRLARFQREAELLATLNHPNIAGIYGLEEANGVRALVLELVEGPTLADRIAKGPIPIDEALLIGRQVADALEAAHEQGIVHRDLKPANIKVRSDGTVKVLDFGLAKLTEPPAASGAVGLSQSPTITTPAMMTGVGVILGTAAYMSPEQAKGRPADKRSDIWAFGCVLYEMLTGRRAFASEDVSDTLAAILRDEPDWAALPAAMPPSIRTLLRRTIKKDGRSRLADIADARLDIDDAMTRQADTTAPATMPVSQGIRRILALALAGAAVVALTAAVSWIVWRTPGVAPVPIRVAAEVGAGVSVANLLGQGAGANLALSPDGRLVAFVGQEGATSELYIRRLDQLQATRLAGTDDARSPFFSPDGQWVGFFAAGKLKKISISGGAAVTLSNADNGRGGAWGDDGTIIFSPTANPGQMLLRVSEAGGKAEPLINATEGESQRWPQLLPAAKAVLFTSGSSGNFNEGTLVVQRLTDGNRKTVQRGGYFGRYVASGHLVYIHDGTLFAVPFDIKRLQVSGVPAPVLEHVTGGVGTGAAQFAVADNGTAVYLPGEGVQNGQPIVWLNRNGAVSALRAMPSNWSNPRFSPDGQRLAVDIAEGSFPHIWVYDWSSDLASKLTFSNGADVSAVWTPDGRRIAFTSTSASGYALSWQRADGTSEPQPLTASKSQLRAGSWHPSGKWLAFADGNPQTGQDLLVLPIEGNEESGWKPGQPTVFLRTSADEIDPMFSPDGRWIAYVSNESGRNEVFVRPFPGPGGKRQVSNGGGFQPMWSRKRGELLYVAVSATGAKIMAAMYTVEGNSFSPGARHEWSPVSIQSRPRPGWLDLHPDGERVAANVPQDGLPIAKQDRVVFIFNFFDELRRVVPTSKP